MKRETAANFIKGAKHGLPIGLGYFAVSFSLGITARNAGMTAFQGLMISLLNNASAGEYAGISAIRTQAPYLELVFLILITNARYFLMSCALSQRLAPGTPWYHRMLIGFDITDEIFGIGVTHPYPLPPAYMYGGFSTTIPMWALGTMFGVIAGNILPAVAVTALSAAIYGMFIAVVIPPARKDRVILILVAISFAVSGLVSLIPLFAGMSESLRIILLTLVISCAAALIRPVTEEQEGRA
ncbi:MAG: AzlC family ABC transporter permease [Lachnospiraceae bacterium]|nr:AzlC family ABC transporter permease [Lachnospiraceae bacterium]